jgi:Rieske 2Fe-2S family protein
MATKSASELRMTLPARYYTDPANFAAELDRFFTRMWVCVGRTGEISQPGDFLVREVAGESLIVTRQRTGNIGAFFNVCRHRGTRLCTEATGRFTDRIQCPYHAWTYDLEGRLVAAPHMDGVPGFEREAIRLKSVNVGEWDGLLFVCLDDPPPSLDAQIGGLREKFAAWQMAELLRAHRITYDVQANWKLIIQNYSECLHCPIIHPALQRLSHYMTGDNDPATDSWLGGSMRLREEVFTMSRDGRQRRATLPGLDDEQRRRVYYYAMLPNLLLSLHPDYVMTHTLWPQAPGRTTVVCEWLFHPREHENPAFDPTDVIDFWDETNRQDWRVSELSQAGIGSRAYEPGFYSGREGLLWDLDRLVLKRLED